MTRKFFGLFRNQRCQMSKHPLETHVCGIAGCLDFACIVISKAPVGTLGHRDECHLSLADVNDVGFSSRRGHKSAISDKISRECGNADEQHSSEDHRGQERQTRIGNLHCEKSGAVSIRSPETAEIAMSACRECCTPKLKPERDSTGEIPLSRRECLRRKRHLQACRIVTPGRDGRQSERKTGAP